MGDGRTSVVLITCLGLRVGGFRSSERDGRGEGEQGEGDSHTGW